MEGSALQPGAWRLSCWPSGGSLGWTAWFTRSGRDEPTHRPPVFLNDMILTCFSAQKASFHRGRQMLGFFHRSVGASVQVLNKSRLGDSVLVAGVNRRCICIQYRFVLRINKLLLAGSDLSGWTNELVPGLKFRVSDCFLYTPEPPAFFTGGQPGETSDIFTRGIQAVRANTLDHCSAQGNYSLSRSVGLQTKYTYSILRVGQIFTTSPAGAPVQFFDATLHTLSAGPTYQLRGRDTLFFSIITLRRRRQDTELVSNIPLTRSSRNTSPRLSRAIR